MGKTVEIPDAQYAAIEAILKDDPALGYESVDEFVRESIRKNYETY